MAGKGGKKQAVLFLTTGDSPEHVARFNTIGDGFDKFVMHEKRLALGYGDSVNHVFIPDFECPYTLVQDGWIPCSTVHFLTWFIVNSDYDHVWLFEDDLVFNGEGNELLHVPGDIDFVCHKFCEPAKSWGWIDFSYLPPVFQSLTLEKRSSLCCACRMSKQAALMVDLILRAGACAHHELFFPTMIQAAGFKTRDLVSLGLADEKLFRFRPVLTDEEIENATDGFFIHPAKITQTDSA